MRCFLIFFATLALSAVTSCRPQGEQRPSALSDADREAIQSVTNQFQQHLVARNADSLANLYTEDALVMPPNQPPVSGRDAIRQWQAAFPPVAGFTLASEEIDGTGDLAYVRGQYVMTMPGAPPDTGKYVEIRRRQPDGSWKIAVDIFNSNLAAAPPPKP